MISIILPTYNEQDNLSVLHSRLVDLVTTIPQHTFEFIFVDDCSRDKTPDILHDIAITDDRVKTIRFARNCGSHAAVAAGLQFCKGDLAIMLAADLQDPPEIIPDLIAKWEKGFRVVWGVRKNREGEHFTVAEGSSVGLGSRVVQDVGAGTVVAGNPARFLRNLQHKYHT